MTENIDQGGTRNAIANIAQRVLKPKIIRDWTANLRKDGFSGFVKQKGWKIVVAIFLFYLIRDSFLYIFLPYMAARGLLGC